MTTSRRFRFGVNVGRAEPGSAWVEQARRLEGMDYSTLFVPDTLGSTLSPLPALAVAAAATRTLRVGTYVLANDFRNPLLVAREAATLDVLSDGRVELGLGLGRPGAESDHRQLGIPFDPVGVRGQRLVEAVEIIKRLFAGETVTAIGRHYAIREAKLFPTPVQRPRPPILIAASGPRGVRRAARLADVVAVGLPLNATPAQLSERVAWVREAAEPRLPELELNVMLGVFPDGPGSEPVRQATRRTAGWMDLNLDAALRSGEAMPLLLTGPPEHMVEQVMDLRERYGITYFNVADFAAGAMAPVVERLTGT